MTSYMDQKWRDAVQKKLDKAISVKELDEIMQEQMDNEDPLEFEDINNLLAYMIVMGLKNNDLTI